MIKKIFIGFIFLMLYSCTNSKMNKDYSLQYSFMPSYIDIDSILSVNLDDTNRVVDSTYSDFKSIPIDSGILITLNDTINIPAGVLISDRKAALYVFYKAAWERQVKELKYLKYLMKDYYEKTRAAETLYQKQVDILTKECERSWYEKNIGYIGLITGMLFSVLFLYSLPK